VIEAVLFDWGGTLTSFHSIDLLDAWRVVAEVLAPERVDELAAALLEAEHEVWARTSTTMRSARTSEVLRAASDAVGLPVDEVLHELAVSSYLDHWAPTTRPRPDAVPTLRAISARGLSIGLLSNSHWPRHQHESWLARDGLLDLIDERVYTSDLEHVKPHPAAFAALVDALGVDPRRCVFVGDRLMDDVHGAKNVGMRAVWLRNAAVPRYDVEPDAVIDELIELVDVVDTWAQAG
jgi:putative hydrolase of the HAD superfamily